MAVTAAVCAHNKTAVPTMTSSPRSQARSCVGFCLCHWIFKGLGNCCCISTTETARWIHYQACGIYFSAVKLKTSGSWLCVQRNLCKVIPQKKLVKLREKCKKSIIIVFKNNRYCVFPPSWAAVARLAHIISGGSAETEGLWTPRQQLFKERVSGACAASAQGPGVSLTCRWQLGARNNAVSWPQWIPCRFTLQTLVLFFLQFLCSFSHFFLKDILGINRRTWPFEMI